MIQMRLSIYASEELRPKWAGSFATLGGMDVTESDGTLRHLVFFEELGKMDESDPSWRAVSAGLVTMRLVDQWIADGPVASRVDSWAVSAVREAIAQVPDTTPIRRILSTIVDVMTTSTAVDLHALCPRLMAYGQALEYEAKWALAADVYQTIAAHSHPVEDADLAVGAHLQLAFCLRTIGDLDSASTAYSRASDVATQSGDLIGVLRSQLGHARVSIAHGNLPQAESILEDAIGRADAPEMQDIRSRALHERAHVAGLKKQYERAIQLAYQALEISTTPRHRDRLLSDIAAAFMYLGLHDVAQDAYLVLATTAQEQYVRWISEINLIEVAAKLGSELQFDRYRRNLRDSEFTPQLRVTYLIHVGRGYQALGKPEEGIEYLERAVTLADEFGLNQLLFEAEAALVESRAKRTTKAIIAPDVPDGLKGVVGVIQELKELAGVS